MKEDLRIIKTKKLLYTTLIGLMKDQSFENIKVSDICNKALINRSTFYAHYRDKYDLLVDLINSLKEGLIDALNKNEHTLNTKDYFLELIKLLIDYIDKEKDIYYEILINNRNSIMTDIIMDVISDDINKRIQNDHVNKVGIPEEIVTKFYLGAVTSVGLEWLNNPNKYSKEELIRYLETLIPENIGNK